MKMSQDLPSSASIVIPTKNAGPSFRETLRHIFLQRVRPLEVLVIDSGSTDGTVSLCRSFPVRLIRIRPETFGHGRTRNLGGSLAKGDFLVFLSQDAVPVSENWLSALLAPFLEEERVAGVFGRQCPREADPFESFCRNYTYPSSSRRYTLQDLSGGPPFRVFFSNVNAAIRRDLWLRFPFEEGLIVSEDQAWARRLLREGHDIWYESAAEVYHSHQDGPVRLLKRSFDAGVSFYQMSLDGMPRALSEAYGYLREETRFLVREGKEFWIPFLLPREALRAGGFLLGRYGSKIPRPVKRWLSLHTLYWKKR